VAILPTSPDSSRIISASACFVSLGSIRLGSPFVLFVGVPFDVRLAPSLCVGLARYLGLGLGESDRSRSNDTIVTTEMARPVFLRRGRARRM